MSARIPAGFNTITPSIACKDAKASIELYKKAFGATVDTCMIMPDGSGKVMHACLTVGTSKLMLADEMPGCGAVPSDGQSPVAFYLYFEDADAAQQKAISAGMKEFMPVTDMFWGDRMGCVVDHNGYRWNLAHFVREVSPAELEEGAKEMAKAMRQAA